MRICGIENCERKVVARGLCNSHYQMWYRGYSIPTFDLKGPHGNRQEDIEIVQPSAFELGWLCGLLEGEGHFSYAGTQQLVLGMTDEDVIAKARRLFERILNRETPIHVVISHTGRSNDLTMFTIRLYGANARAIMRLIVSHMGDRRRAKIWQTLNGFAGKHVDIQSIISRIGNG